VAKRSIINQCTAVSAPKLNLWTVLYYQLQKLLLIKV